MYEDIGFCKLNCLYLYKVKFSNIWSLSYVIPSVTHDLCYSWLVIFCKNNFFSWPDFLVLCSWTTSTDLTCILSDIYGFRYTCIQVWRTFCMDHFIISGCICRFYIVRDAGSISPSNPLFTYDCSWACINEFMHISFPICYSSYSCLCQLVLACVLFFFCYILLLFFIFFIF